MLNSDDGSTGGDKAVLWTLISTALSLPRSHICFPLLQGKQVGMLHFTMFVFAWEQRKPASHAARLKLKWQPRQSENHPDKFKPDIQILARKLDQSKPQCVNTSRTGLVLL